VNLYVLAKQTSDVAAANGFDVPTFDNLPTKVAFAMTELFEAADAKDDRTAFTEELADAVMRILGILYPVWGDDWTASRVEQRRRPPPGAFCAAFDPVEVLLFAPFRHLCRAVEDWRYNLRGDVKIDLELALLELWRLADSLGLDLDWSIEQKLEKNKGRGHLHGKVRSEG
jgi:hypothetical protein